MLYLWRMELTVCQLLHMNTLNIESSCSLFRSTKHILDIVNSRTFVVGFIRVCRVSDCEYRCGEVPCSSLLDCYFPILHQGCVGCLLGPNNGREWYAEYFTCEGNRWHRTSIDDNMFRSDRDIGWICSVWYVCTVIRICKLISHVHCKMKCAR